MQPIVNKGVGIEIYGTIFHEHGVTEYYALNRAGERFVGVVDLESGVGCDEAVVVQEWLSFVPENVQKQFPEVFCGRG